VRVTLASNQVSTASACELSRPIRSIEVLDVTQCHAEQADEAPSRCNKRMCGDRAEIRTLSESQWHSRPRKTCVNADRTVDTRRPYGGRSENPMELARGPSVFRWRKRPPKETSICSQSCPERDHRVEESRQKKGAVSTYTLAPPRSCASTVVARLAYHVSCARTPFTMPRRSEQSFTIDLPHLNGFLPRTFHLRALSPAASIRRIPTRRRRGTEQVTPMSKWFNSLPLGEGDASEHNRQAPV